MGQSLQLELFESQYAAIEGPTKVLYARIKEARQKHQHETKHRGRYELSEEFRQKLEDLEAKAKCLVKRVRGQPGWGDDCPMGHMYLKVTGLAHGFRAYLDPGRARKPDVVDKFIYEQYGL